MAGPPYEIGVNVYGLFYEDTVFSSPDILATAQSPVLYDKNGNVAIQATLAVPYVGGSEVMQLAGTNPFTVSIQNGTTNGTSGFISTASGTPTFNCNGVGGSPFIYITSWGNNANDVNYPAGTIVNLNNGVWGNNSTSSANWPLNPQYLDTGGRPTGYPQGLNPGQSFLIQVSNYVTSVNPGTYTILASGTGTVQFILHFVAGGAQSGVVNINVTAGVPASTLTLPSGQFIFRVFITASSTSAPLYNVRVIMPDRPGYMDDFVGQYQAQASNPYFFLPHPTYVNSLKPFSLLRYMDTLAIIDNPMVINWADRPVWNGVGPGISPVVGSAGTPFEYMTALANAVGADVWWNIHYTFSPDFLTNVVPFLLANVNSPQKIAVEFGNENWNGGFREYFFCLYQACCHYNANIPTSITYSGGTATVTFPNHGFTSGDTVQIINATDDGYNGAYVIGGVTTNTFTYTPSVAPGSSPAAPIPFHSLMALDQTTNSWYRTLTSETWNGFGSITIVTTANHGCAVGDVIATCNASDPAYNGLWNVVTVTNSTTLAVQFQGQYYNRLMPSSPTSGSNTVVAKSGQSLAFYRIGNDVGGNIAGLCNFNSFQSAYIAQTCATIHQAFYNAMTGQESRLVCCLMWQMPFGPGSGWANDPIIADYKADLGGSFLAGAETAIGAAPYYTIDSTGTSTYFGGTTANAVFILSSLTFAAGVATATTSSAHGYPDGSTVGIYNASQAPYCGIFTITVTSPTTFTYPVVGSPTSPATVANTSIPANVYSALNPPYFRELTAVSIVGNTMTCTSTNHGWTSGMLVNLCGGVAARSMTNLYPGNYGQFLIDVIDVNTFSVTLPSNLSTGANVLPTNSSRMWAWDSSAINVLVNDLNQFAILSNQFAGVQYTANQYPGVTIRTYEGGAGYEMNLKYPFMFDFQRTVHNHSSSNAMTAQYLNLLYNTYGVTCFNQFNHIFQYNSSGLWGIKECQDEINPPGWDAFMQACAGTPDYTNDGVFPGFLGPAVVCMGGPVLGGNAQGYLGVPTFTVDVDPMRFQVILQGPGSFTIDIDPAQAKVIS